MSETEGLYGVGGMSVECAFGPSRHHEWRLGYTYTPSRGIREGDTVIVVFCQWCLIVREADPPEAQQ